MRHGPKFAFWDPNIPSLRGDLLLEDMPFQEEIAVASARGEVLKREHLWTDPVLGFSRMISFSFCLFLSASIFSPAQEHLQELLFH